MLKVMIGILATVLSFVNYSEYKNIKKSNVNILEKAEKDLMIFA